MERKAIKNAKRIVVKIGTSVLAAEDFNLDENWLKDFTDQVAEILKQDREVIIVSSGAIAAGMGLLGLKKRPKSLPEQQACAALGQGYLMKTYEECFKKKGFHAAQILLTWEDVRDRRRYLNAENTLNALLKKKVVPVINENDTVSIDEIKFGDNDRLSALVAGLVDADILIMLTDVDGLRMGDEYVDSVHKIDAKIEKIVSGTDKETSKGGMVTKLDACKIAMGSGISCVIANGRHRDILLRVVNGERIGTLFIPAAQKLSARKRWIAYNARPKGKIFIDDGARCAIIEKNKSLLACGIKKVEGHFAQGDIVLILDMNGHEVARGVSAYSALELEKLKGATAKSATREAVHRDNMVILGHS